jgi:GNAT superfamily N-acetyltransferase
MLDLTVALASIENFYRRIYWHADEATTVEAEAYTLTYSGIPWMHSVNQLWLHRPAALDDNLLKLACQFFKRYHAEFSVVFTAAGYSSLPYWLTERFYLERAATPIYGLNGMPRPPFVHRDVTIERAKTEHQEALLSVLNRTFFMGTEAGRSIVRNEHFHDSTIRHYLALVENEAAACGTIILSEGLAGVWNIGTLRPFRRQGIAAALLMRALAEAAADGYTASVLMASPMGKPLYEAMGYQFLANTYFYGQAE